MPGSSQSEDIFQSVRGSLRVVKKLRPIQYVSLNHVVWDKFYRLFRGTYAHTGKKTAALAFNRVLLVVMQLE